MRALPRLDAAEQGNQDVAAQHEALAPGLDHRGAAIDLALLGVEDLALEFGRGTAVFESKDFEAPDRLVLGLPGAILALGIRVLALLQVKFDDRALEGRPLAADFDDGAPGPGIGVEREPAALERVGGGGLRQRQCRQEGRKDANGVCNGAIIALVLLGAPARAEMPPFFSLGVRPEKDILAAGVLYFNAPQFAGSARRRRSPLRSADFAAVKLVHHF